MQPLIPRPTRITTTTDTFPAPEALRARAPGWASTVLDALAGTPFFPSVTRTTDESAEIVVKAPEDASLVPSELPDSSYELEIGGNGITIRCAQPAGLVSALRTLHGLRTGDGFQGATVTDTPAHRYRGLHIDVCRHFFGVDFLKRTIALASALGLNVLHWHLTEDQGWRLPVDSWPALNEVGAYRTEQDGTRYGGFYTKAQVLEIVQYAGLHGMLVIPEVELPGHAQAAIASYPQLSCQGAPVPVRTTWGISEEVFCAGNDEVFRFLEDIFAEVVELFPSRYIHIGGDECPKTRWKSCPKCQARIAQEGLSDEDELQSYFVSRVTKALAQRGRTAIGWDEILEGGLPAGTTVMSWRGTEGGIRAAGLGHDVIMTPTKHCYFDYRQVDADDEIGFPNAHSGGRPPVLTLPQVLAFDPLNGLSDEVAAHVMGGQANVWTEQLDTEAKVEYMIAPRLLAMAEALWTAPRPRDYADFRARARDWLDRLDEFQWSHGPLP